MRKSTPLDQIRLRDLGRWHYLNAKCLTCRRGSVVEHARLIGRFDPEITLDRLARHLRCRACGKRDLMKTFVVETIGR